MLAKKRKTYFTAKVIATLPIFISVNIASLVIWVLGVSPEAMPLILGMIAAGLVDLDNRLIGRLQNILAMFVVFSASAIIVQLSIGKPILFTLLLTALAFVVTMFGAIGQRYSTVAFGVLLVAVYTVLTYSPTVPWFINPVLIVLGALLYSLSALCVFFVFPNRAVQESVGEVFDALGQYLQEKSHLFEPETEWEKTSETLALAVKNARVVQALNVCQGVLFYRIQGRQRRSQIVQMMKLYFSAQEIFERLSADYVIPQQFAKRYPHSDILFRIQRILTLQGQHCQWLAQSLQNHTAFSYDPRLGQCVKGLAQAFLYFQQQYPQDKANLHQIKSLVESLQTVDEQLRYMETSEDKLTEAKSATLQPVQITGLKNMYHAICRHWTVKSPIFRHAVRLSVIVFCSCVLVESLELHLGYWILLTAILVCQPNHYATRLRLKQRMVGSLLGVLVASLLPYMQSSLVLELGIIVLTSSLFFFFRTNNYSYATFFITVQVLVSFYVMGFDIADAMFNRIIDTIIGGGMALLASLYLCPDWKYLNLPNMANQSIRASAKYLLFVLGQLQFGQNNLLQYRIVRRVAQDRASELGNVVNMMNSQQKTYQDRLTHGLELVKLNYTLLSYIASLGAYRTNMQHTTQTPEFMMGFYPIGKEIAELLKEMEMLSPDTFTKRVWDIQQKLDKHTGLPIEVGEMEKMGNFLFNQLNLMLGVVQKLYEIRQ